MKLSNVGSSAFVSWNSLNFHNLYGMSSGSVFGTHVSVALSYSAFSCQVSVFSVHIVCTTSGVISQPDTEIFDFQWFSLKDLFL